MFYVMHLDDEDARVLLATLRQAVDRLTERLGPSTAELPAFPGGGASAAEAAATAPAAAATTTRYDFARRAASSLRSTARRVCEG